MRAIHLVLSACLLTLPGTWAQAPAKPAAVDDAQARRERNLKMAEIIRALELADGSRVADIGAGGGDYEIPMSRAVGAAGHIYAEDISPGSINRLHERVKESGLGNVEVIEGVPDDPKLPAAALDGVLMVITYHEVADYKQMLEHVAAALKPGGRFVIVDMTPHKTLTRPRVDQTKNHVIAPDLAQSEIQQAGFEMVSRDDHFIDNPDEESTRWMMVFRKPAA